MRHFGRRIGLAVVLVAVAAGSASAQWAGPPYGGRSSPYYRQPQGFFDWGWNDDEYRRPRYAPRVQSGGERPQIEAIQPRLIAFPNSFPLNSVVIDSRGRQLFFIQSATEALHYPISVGREGFSWTGSETVSRKAEWPDWHPPEEMRDRDPRLPEKMTGGIKNPLGAMALYLGSSLYRIHGTNDASSIGRAASSGCFRMLNGHVVDLASRVDVGTVVTVVSRLPPELESIVAEQVGLPRQAPVARRERAF